jgi:hypothetical protein
MIVMVRLKWVVEAHCFVAMRQMILPSGMDKSGAKRMRVLRYCGREIAVESQSRLSIFQAVFGSEHP